MNPYCIKLCLLTSGLALSMQLGCASSAPPPAQTTPPPMPTAVSMPPSDEMTVVHRDSTRPSPGSEANEKREPTTNLTPQNSALSKKLQPR